MKNYLSKEEGYIALMSVIVISAILLLISTATSFKGYYGRYGVLETEFKKESQNLAEACADQAILELAKNVNFQGDATSTISSKYECYIYPITKNFPTPGKTTIKTRAIYQDSYTYLEITINQSDLSVDKWMENASF